MPHKTKYNIGMGMFVDMLCRGLGYNTIDDISKIPPSHITEVLKQNGWVLADKTSSQREVWQKIGFGKFHQVTVPFDDTQNGYSEDIIRAVYSAYMYDGIGMQDFLSK